MKTKLNGILTLLLALVVQVAFAQQTVIGKVTDADGGLLGAVVQVKGTSNATTTDFDGNYTIVANSTDVLLFTFTGYDSQEIVVGEQNVINVTMSVNELDAVVVNAYKNTTTKQNNVASFQLDSKSIADRPNASAIQRLQGQVPGLTVQTSTGQPGGNSFIQLRGPVSINGNSEPLIIIDGVPIDEDAFQTINPADIESTTTLVDAAATAIYGNRGANGVIIIKTRTAKFGAPLKVSYSTTTGFSQLIDRDYNMFDARGLLRFENSIGAGLGVTLTTAEIDAFESNTDWEEVFFQTGTNINHNIRLSSGGKNISQTTSISYFEQEASLSNRTLQRFNARSNVNFKSDNERFTASTTLALGYSDSRFNGTDGSGSVFFNPVWAAYNGLPYLDVNDFDSNNLTGAAAFTFANAPFINLDSQQFDRVENDQVKLIVGGDMAYKISENWKARYRIGLDYTQDTSFDGVSPESALARVRASFSAEPFEGIVNQDFARDVRFNSNINLEYAKKFGAGETDEDKKHGIIVNGYLEYFKGHFDSFGFRQEGLDPRTYTPGDGASFIADNGNNDDLRDTARADKLEYGLFSYFGNAAYDYDSKYGAEVTVRRDRSSRFQFNDGWGTFFSGALRWNISEEKFFENLRENNTVNLLKLRLSYGETGNDRINGGFYDALRIPRQLFVTGQGYQDNQTFVPSATVPDSNVRWETVKTLNLGIDYVMFDQRLRGSIELYNRRTDDLFSPQQISLLNPSSSTNSNVGSIRNNGITFNADYNVVRSNEQDGFNLSVGANLTYNDDEVLDLSPEDGRIDDGGLTVLQEGQRVGEFFLAEYAGVNPANGNLLFRDIDGNLTEDIDNADRKFNGSSLNAKFFGGFNTRASYKNFFFEAQFSFQTGTGLIDNDYDNALDANFAGNGNLSSDILRAWTPDNRITDIPSLSATNINPGANSDRFFVDTSFLKLRFLQLGYNLPKVLTDRSFLESGRIFVNGENLLTWSDFRGSDPEQRRTNTFVDFPQARIYSIGLELNF
ncbi:SusC/RagA family TonB-linked outer membrane protein [Nonlabens sp. Asnod3-A02]|uniref:SusC/RagA family TonB-linked outer membrane protein n=1 Tax=Nonlabens sp. Asnod3-A02 TaxID=3160579 RepID=UPI00386B0208